MFSISWCSNKLGGVALQRRWIAGVPKETIFDIINTARRSNQLIMFKDDERLQHFIREALRNPTRETVQELMQVKRKMIRSLRREYFLAVDYIEQGMSSEVDKLKFRTEFQKQVSPLRYHKFLETLEHLRTQKGYDRPTRRKELYKAIELHRWSSPNTTKSTGILLPDSIHQWFYMAIPKEERLNHFSFLIENNVIISGHYAEKFHSVLLKGSQLEYQMATFQNFIRDPSKKHIFEEKFTVMYAFKPMRNIVNLLIANNDLEHITDYFDALITRLEHFELKNDNIPYNVRKSYFIEFMHSLQYYARRENRIDMFLQITKVLMNSLPKDIPNSLMRKPLVEILSHFQKNQDIETVFKIMSLFDKLGLTKPNSKFTNEVLGRIMYSLRNFQDPKLTASYILSTHPGKNTRVMLNSLGLWCLIFDGKFGHLPLQTIKDLDIKQKHITVNVPKSFTHRYKPDVVILNELYIVVFDYYKKKLSKEEYKELVLKCFNSYCSFVKDTVPSFKSWRIDTGILRTMIHRAKYDLNDNRLAYDMLMRFYSLNVNPQFDNNNTPFGLVLYGNHVISQEEFNKVLELMQKFNAPMDSKLLTTIILRFLKSNDTHSAHEWYNRYLKVGYHLKHFKLIEEAKRHEWEVPNAAEKYYQECVERNKSEEDDSFDDIYLQNPAEDSYTDELLKIAEKFGDLANVSVEKQPNSAEQNKKNIDDTPLTSIQNKEHVPNKVEFMAGKTENSPLTINAN